MADTQDPPPPPPQSIAQRIAALKLDQGAPPVPRPHQARPRPPPPPRPVSAALPTPNGSAGQVGNLPAQGERPALPPRTATRSSNGGSPRRPSEGPALPARRPSAAPSASGDSRRPSATSSTAPSATPSADSRRPSTYTLSRRGSAESASSAATTRSTASDRHAVKAPPYDPASLPPLPPKRTAEEREAESRVHRDAGARPGLGSRKSMPGLMVGKGMGTTPPPLPPPNGSGRALGREVSTLPGTGKEGAGAGPPPLPARASTAQVEAVRSPPPSSGRETVPPPPRKSALTMGFSQGTTKAPTVPGRPVSVPQTDGAAPPPVPKDSRPDLAALQASKPKTNGSARSTIPTPQPASTASSCLHCRDFSAPDAHAARFPRESIPSHDLGWLAHQLTAPFPSATDKARALFTWLHHNIAYDTVSFFNHTVQPSTPHATLATGLAVCEGYAGLFAALALRAGLEAYVVGGHGKGYGHTPLRPGQPLPVYAAGHAWNAVKIDTGAWKLIDCCWGAGCISGAGQPYTKRFAPERFTQSNEEFGLDHFPGDASKQFRGDGRVVTWEEYITGNENGCGADFFAGFVAEEGLAKTSFCPHEGRISLSALPGPTLRFQFQKVCPHWDPVRNGRGPFYLYVLAFEGGGGGGGKDAPPTPFESDGSVWWCDVPVEALGPPGAKVHVNAITTFDGQDGRGLTAERYRRRIGRCGWAAGGVCKWDVVA